MTAEPKQNVFAILGSLSEEVSRLDREVSHWKGLANKLADQLQDACDGVHERDHRISELELEVLRLRGGES